jgi:hypothetical protein
MEARVRKGSKRARASKRPQLLPLSELVAWIARGFVGEDAWRNTIETEQCELVAKIFGCNAVSLVCAGTLDPVDVGKLACVNTELRVTCGPGTLALAARQLRKEVVAHSANVLHPMVAKYFPEVSPPDAFDSLAELHKPLSGESRFVSPLDLMIRARYWVQESSKTRSFVHLALRGHWPSTWELCDDFCIRDPALANKLYDLVGKLHKLQKLELQTARQDIAKATVTT